MSAAFKAFNQSFSCRGGLVLPITVDFSSQTEIEIDFQSLLDTNVIDFISSVFLDNRNGTTEISLETNVIGQTAYWRPNTLGYFPLMLDNQGSKVVVQSSGVTPNQRRFIFSNIPFFPFYQTF